MRFKIWVKDTAKRRQLDFYRRQLNLLVGFMEPAELYKFLIAEHIMDYKLLIRKLNERLKTDASLH